MSVDEPLLRRCFDEKIAGVRAYTTDAAPPLGGCELTAFRVLTIDDAIADIRKRPHKRF